MLPYFPSPAIEVTLSGIVIAVKDVQPLKALSPINVVLVNEIDGKELQLKNDEPPTLTILSAFSTSVKAPQLQKHNSTKTIFEEPELKVTFVNALQLKNALPFIVFNPDPNVTLGKDVQLKNASPPILVISEPNVTLIKPVLFNEAGTAPV